MSISQNEGASWVQAQKSTFENWVNQCLKEKGFSIKDLKKDLRDGLVLNYLYEELTGKAMGKFDKKPKMKIIFVQNLNLIINAFKEDQVKIVNVQGEDIYEENLKLILGLLWMLIQRYHILGAEQEKNSAAKALLLDFVNTLVPHPKVKNFRKDWKDGVILSELVDQIQPGCFPSDSRPSDAPELVRRALDVAEERLGVPQIIQAKYILHAVDELSMMTYVSYLKKKYEENILTPSGPNCVASGSGLEDSENSASPHHFQVELRNCYGGLCPIPEDAVSSAIKIAVDGPTAIEPSLRLDDCSVCYVSYEATAPGDLAIRISVGPDESVLAGSPFAVKISAKEVAVSGRGVENCEFAENEELPILIDAGANSSDLFGEGKLGVTVKSPDGSFLEVRCESLMDGKYAGWYKPRRRGPHHISVNLWGEKAFEKEVSLVREADKRIKTHLSGELYQRKVFPDNRATGFVVRVDDGNGSPVQDAEVEVAIRNAKMELAGEVSVEKSADGSFEVTADEVKELGLYVVEVLVNGESKEKFYAKCEKGTQPELATGSFRLEVQARDREGNLKTNGGDTWEVAVKGPEGARVDVETADLGDGRYSATYHLTANADGDSVFEVTARLDGGHVAGSPFKHSLSPKMSLGERVRGFFGAKKKSGL